MVKPANSAPCSNDEKEIFSPRLMINARKNIVHPQKLELFICTQ